MNSKTIILKSKKNIKLPRSCPKCGDQNVLRQHYIKMYYFEEPDSKEIFLLGIVGQLLKFLILGFEGKKLFKAWICNRCMTKARFFAVLEWIVRLGSIVLVFLLLKENSTKARPLFERGFATNFMVFSPLLLGWGLGFLFHKLYVNCYGIKCLGTTKSKYEILEIEDALWLDEFRNLNKPNVDTGTTEVIKAFKDLAPRPKSGENDVKPVQTPKAEAPKDEEILTISEQSTVHKFLVTTYQKWRDGDLNKLSDVYKNEASQYELEKFVKAHEKYTNDLKAAIKLRPFDDDEYLVTVQEDHFVLTSKALYYFKKNIKAILLREIADVKEKGWLDITQTITLQSGEQLLYEKMDFVPQKKFVLFMRDKLIS